MTTSRHQRLWIIPILAFVAGVVVAASTRRPAATRLTPIITDVQDVIYCQSRAPLQLDFVPLADLESQARQTATSDPQIARPPH